MAPIPEPATTPVPHDRSTPSIHASLSASTVAFGCPSLAYVNPPTRPSYWESSWSGSVDA